MSLYNVNGNFIPDKIDFPKEEENVLKYWKEISAFEKSLKLSEGKPEFSFFDGPPFATGLPHYGHILAGTVKDIITRYAHQTGHHVTRRFGWDCHGLPVEHEIDKIHNIKGPNDVMTMGIKNYNDACRSIVSRYSSEWESIVGRLGRWIDFKNDYKTMYPWFMESVWWTFKEVFQKGLVYRSCRVMPFSTACSTPLSNFETSQNYKDTVDPSIVIKFPILGQSDTFLLAWTTTPWTLPSNLCLVVNPIKTYLKLKEKKTGSVIIMMEARVPMLYSNKSEYEVIEKFDGQKLVGMKYIPPFDYFKSFESKGGFTVYSDTYVTDDSGTGIVHSAPAFGEDDLRVCLKNNVVTRVEELPCPVDATGKFTDPVIDFLGQYVKDADSKIIKHLKERKLVVLHSQHKHSYPFCWRSDTPILYKAVPSWFIRVESMINDLLENNKKCHWVPEHVRDRRFHNWLANARDWNISRNRYWGTPIPLWISDDGEEVVCVGSINELYELSGVKVTDLHRENIDNITIPSKLGKGLLHRTPEVFDCWFESGSMPYSQSHYPFKNKPLFDATFPADFVAEGIDQTRGWFYTLLVLSTALFNKPPFKNLIVTGLVLASDGQKMSKRKKNYPDPLLMVNKYGADCVRCYLINSPVVCGENLCFKESGLVELLKEFFIPWFNAFRFFTQNRAVYEKNSGKSFIFDEKLLNSQENILDKWLLSCSQSLISKYRHEIDSYRLFNLVPNLQNQINNITKWYIRMNRTVIRGDNGLDSQLHSLNILFYALFQFTHVSSQLCPFVSEYYFQRLKQHLPNYSDESYESIHFRMIPQPNTLYIHKDVERIFECFTLAVDLARKIREKNNCAMKHPLSELVIVHPSNDFLADVEKLDKFIKEDLNVKIVTYTKDQSQYGLFLSIEPNFALLGKRLKGELKSVMKKVNALSQEDLLNSLESGQISIESHILTLDEVRIVYEVNPDFKSKHYDVGANKQLAVLLNIKPDSDLEDEGLARDFVHRIQRLRKKALVHPTDDIALVYKIEKSSSQEEIDKLVNALNKNMSLIENIIKKPVYNSPEKLGNSLNAHLEESFELGGSTMSLTLYR